MGVHEPTAPQNRTGTGSPTVSAHRARCRIPPQGGGSESLRSTHHAGHHTDHAPRTGCVTANVVACMMWRSGASSKAWEPLGLPVSMLPPMSPPLTHSPSFSKGCSSSAREYERMWLSPSWKSSDCAVVRLALLSLGHLHPSCCSLEGARAPFDTFVTLYS